ncbi:MAG TPA: DUF6293 family protein [Candidatus Thermoplasmatota archaeon]|nr:DUF6293 family protein [Candidatus Thermoplasmatota archaeon]
MKVLVTGHGEMPDAVKAARRLVPHGKVVVLTTKADDPEFATMREDAKLERVQVEIHAVEAMDLDKCLAAAKKVLDSHARDEVRIHVAGGPNLLTNALLLAAFERGIDAFYCHEHGVSHLPIAVTVKVEDRFTEYEREVLLAMPSEGDITVPDLARRGPSTQGMKGALRKLRERGLVHATHETARLTPVGLYYQGHFRRARREPA